jgi:hypothetical protein
VLYFTTLKADEKLSNYLLWSGIAIRFVLIFTFPFFSDDIYRFWWDGKLIANGINPFNETPRYFIDNQIFTDELSRSIFLKLNSPDYYSVYPPVCQLIFFLSYWLSPKSIYGAAIVIKIFLFLCEFGTIRLLSKHFKSIGINKKSTLLYALNPLVIIELCGNAHFEAAMLFFFVASLAVLFSITLKVENGNENKVLEYFFSNELSHVSNKKIGIAGLLFSFSITSKLFTLTFLPFIIRSLGWKKGAIFGLITLICTLFLFYLFYTSTFIAHFQSSLNLYFQKFEFNASVYYLLKELGKAYYGYSPTALIARMLSVFTLFALSFSYFKIRDFFTQIFFFSTCYLLFQSTVHPWYLSTLVLLTVFVPFRYAIWWSGLMILTYSHYWNNIYQENFFLIFVEYVILGFLIFLEWAKVTSFFRKY